MKNISERFASAGFTALAPDLYRGKIATTADEASHLMSDLDWDKAMVDVQNAVKYLKARGVEKVAVLGFCLGGALTIAAACRVTNLNGGSNVRLNLIG